MVEQFALEAQHVVDRHLIHQTLNTGPDRDDLLLHRIGRVLRLAEQLHQPPPRSSWRRIVALRSEANIAKACMSRYWASSSLSEPATFFIALIWAAPPTRDTEIPTSIAGR